MPFVSEAQKGLFYAKARRGEMDPAMVAKWQAETPKGIKLPKRLHKKAFWCGFEKEAGKMKELWGDALGLYNPIPTFKKFADIMTGGGGHTGVGKGELGGQLEAPLKEGPTTQGTPGGDDTKTDKTLLDRERNPRDFSPFSLGEEFTVESNPHIRY